MSDRDDPIALACEQLIRETLPERPAEALLQTLVAACRQVVERRLRDLKLEAMAEFAAGAGHEINNPAATIAGRAALLLKTETDPERRRALETIGGQAYRIRDMIGDAMTFARPPLPKPETLRVATELHQVWTSFEQRFDAKKIRVEWQNDDTLQLVADREQFRVVVSCLLRNALENLSAEQRVVITAAPHTDAEASHVRLSFEDNGPGLTEVERAHLFDPFFSGRSAGRGLGFGLSKCWRIVSLHGGRIEAELVPSGGLAIHSYWPSPHTTALPSHDD